MQKFLTSVALAFAMLAAIATSGSYAQIAGESASGHGNTHANERGGRRGSSVGFRSPREFTPMAPLPAMPWRPHQPGVRRRERQRLPTPRRHLLHEGCRGTSPSSAVPRAADERPVPSTPCSLPFRTTVSRARTGTRSAPCSSGTMIPTRQATHRRACSRARMTSRGRRSRPATSRCGRPVSKRASDAAAAIERAPSGAFS